MCFLNRLAKSRFLIFHVILIVLLVLGFGTFVFVLFSKPCELYVSDLLGMSKKSEVLKFVGIVKGGILVALQALASHRRAKALEDTVKQTEYGQRQERMKNAIEHLGNNSDSVRLGGAYELFHLAEDTATLRQTVLDILCAHIRQTTSEREYRENHKSKPSEEVQSVLTLLFVQKHSAFDSLQADLTGSWLKGVELRKARLKKAILSETNLQDSDLYGAHLDEAVLARAQLQNAILQGAHLRKAKLHSVCFHKANCNGVRLQAAHLYDAQLEGINLCGAHLENAILERAFLKGANLSNAFLQEADLCGSQLQGANLARARLYGTDLSTAGLQGANLAGAHLHGARLCKAQLQGVRCRGSFSCAFPERVRQSIGRNTDLSTVVFEGGLTQAEIKRLKDHIVDITTIDVLCLKLAPHVDKPISNVLPKNSGAILGTYAGEEAERWIAEYEEAISEDPTDVG